MYIRILNTSGSTQGDLTDGQEAWVNTASGSFRYFELTPAGKMDRLYFESGNDNPAATSTGLASLNGTGGTGRDNFTVEVFDRPPSVGGKMIYTNQN